MKVSNSGGVGPVVAEEPKSQKALKEAPRAKSLTLPDHILLCATVFTHYCYSITACYVWWRNNKSRLFFQNFSTFATTSH